MDSEIIANRIEVEFKNEFRFPISLEEQLKTIVGLAVSHPRMQAELNRLPSNYWQIVDDRCKVAYQKELRAIAGVTETIEGLDVPKCVASSSEPEMLAFKLRHTGLDLYFGEAVFNTKLIKRSKPAPDLFLFALERMGWDVASTFVFEDSVVGVEAGKAAGLYVVGFTVVLMSYLATTKSCWKRGPTSSFLILEVCWILSVEISVRFKAYDADRGPKNEKTSRVAG